MKKSTKVLAGIGAFLLIAVLLYFANELVGNPISKIIANKTAKEYVAKNYSNIDLNIKDAIYSFKDGYYHVSIQSPTSKDTSFEIAISPFGKVEYDSYENYVEDKYNTYNRINSIYDFRVRKVFESKDFPYERDIYFGEIKEKDLVENRENEEYYSPVYGIDRKQLELDKDYDINELGKSAGHIVFYAQDEEITVKKLSEILLNIKNILDDKNISFYAISFTLEKPIDEEGIVNSDDDSINIEEFLYEDIYEKNLEKRLLRAYENTQKYYKKLDEEKLKEERLYDN